MKRIEFLFFVVIIIVCSACNSHSFTDRQGNKYQTVEIGNQEWMAENLATTVDIDGNDLVLGEDYFYPDGDSTKVERYGLLYTWDAAMRVVPKGWHIPTLDEWSDLFETIGRDNTYFDSNTQSIAKAIASSEGWKDCAKNKTIGHIQKHNNSTKFSAMPAGTASPEENFGTSANFWTADVLDDYLAFCQVMLNASDHIIPSLKLKSCAISIRCIRDDSGKDKKEE